MARRAPRAVLGGTFDHLHAGHRALLTAAFERAEVVGIGLTTEAFLAGRPRKLGRVAPYAERERELRRTLERLFPRRAYQILPLKDRWGTLLEPSTGMLVASPETLPVGREANRRRRARGLPPVRLVEVATVLGEDLLPISSTRIRGGLIDGEGHRLRPLQIGLGTSNPVKHAGVRRALDRLLPRVRYQLTAVDPPPGKPQPWGLAEGTRGADARAAAALPGQEYGLGVEATLLTLPGRRDALDVHVVTVTDALGGLSRGLSPGFPVPSASAPSRQGTRTLEETVHALGAPSRVGRSPGGALGYLTRGALSREEFIACAVEAAFVPRLARRSDRLPRVREVPLSSPPTMRRRGPRPSR
jgi:pantetheine-phosphate adenylyltransferase